MIIIKTSTLKLEESIEQDYTKKKISCANKMESKS
jgi:hypothetical protein